MLAQSLKHTFKTRPTVRTPAYLLWLSIALTVTLLAIKTLTELLMVHNQECWRNQKPSNNALDQKNANGFLHSLQP